MHADTEDSSKGEDDVNVEERLVEGVADGRGRGEQNEDHSRSPYCSPPDERVRECFSGDAGPAVTGNLGDHPGEHVDDGFKDDHPSHPAVEQVVGVKADLQQGDERIIASCENDERDHIRQSQHATSSP